MLSTQPRVIQGAQAGFTLQELAVVMVAMVTLAGFAAMGLTDITETAEAGAVEAVQGSLQIVISQASARQDISPLNLIDPGVAPHSGVNVVNALAIERAGEIEVAFAAPNIFTVTFMNSGREASFVVQANGDVDVQAGSLVDFPNFQVVNGAIVRN
jgi:hypothetical protein